MNKSNVIVISLTLFVFIVWGTFFGFHYGWLDDIQDLNIMKGAFVNGCKLFDPDHFIFLQSILQWLYELFPSFPWFGSMLYTILAYSVFTSMGLVAVELQTQSTLIKVVAVSLFLCCFFLENINAINFTAVAVLASGIGLLNCYCLIRKERYSIWKMFLYMLPWIIALLIRKEAVFFTTIIVIVLLFLYTPKHLFKSYTRIMILLISVCSLFLLYEIGYREQTKQNKHIAAFNKYLFTIQDTYQTNTNSLQTVEDSLLLEAVTSWNFFDTHKFNLSLLSKIGYEQPFRKEVLDNLSLRFRYLINESTKYKNYHEAYNWNVKLVFVLLINLLLLFLQVKSQKGKTWQIVLAHFIFWFSLLAVGVFVKMENRLFFPLCTIFTLLNILFIPFNSFKKGKVIKQKTLIFTSGIVIVTSVFFAVVMIRQNIYLAKEFNDELQIKRSFWAELALLRNKILVYDIHALFLLHDSPFKEISLPENNENIVANHFYLTHFDCLNEYYRDRIGSDRIDNITSYLHKNKKDVFLIGVSYNFTFWERYMKGIYGKQYHFKRDTSFHALEKLHHNFLWIPLDLGVYRFDDVVQHEPNLF